MDSRLGDDIRLRKIIKMCMTRKRVKFGELRLILIYGRRTTGRQSVH
jgi:hypothetical protein